MYGCRVAGILDVWVSYDAGPNSNRCILLKLQIKLVSVQFKVEILHNYALIIYCQLTDLKE